MKDLVSLDSTYVCHTHTPENSNTIITILYEKIMELCRFHSPKELTLCFDNHATAKCYLLLAFFEAVVSRWELLGTVRLIFYLRGHSVNSQDVSNEPTSRAFFAMTGYDWLVRPSDVCAVINANTKKNVCQFRNSFFDWSAALSYDSKQLSCGISGHHVFYIDKDGIKVKEFVDSVWHGPFRILTDVKIPPTIANIPSLSDAEIKGLLYLRNSFHWEPEDADYLDCWIDGKVEANGVEKFLFSSHFKIAIL